MVIRIQRFNPTNKYDSLFDQAGQKYNVDPRILKLVWYLESSGRESPGLSSAGAQGPFQFMDSTWRGLKVAGNPNNINDAAFAAAKLLRQNLDQYGNVRDALAAYNAGGPTRWNNEETQGYLMNASLNWNNMNVNSNGGGVIPVAQNNPSSQPARPGLRPSPKQSQPAPQPQSQPQAADPMDQYSPTMQALMREAAAARAAQANKTGQVYGPSTPDTGPAPNMRERQSGTPASSPAASASGAGTPTGAPASDATGDGMGSWDVFQTGFRNGLAMGFGKQAMGAVGAVGGIFKAQPTPPDQTTPAANPLTGMLPDQTNHNLLSGLLPDTSHFSEDYKKGYDQQAKEEQDAQAGPHGWAWNWGQSAGSATSMALQYLATRRMVAPQIAKVGLNRTMEGIVTDTISGAAPGASMAAVQSTADPSRSKLDNLYDTALGGAAGGMSMAVGGGVMVAGKALADIALPIVKPALGALLGVANAVTRNPVSKAITAGASGNYSSRINNALMGAGQAEVGQFPTDQ